MRRFSIPSLFLALAFSIFALASFAAAGGDFGQFVEGQVADHAEQQFGVIKGLDAASTQSLDSATALADPEKLVAVAKPLQVRVVTKNAASNADQMALWPSDSEPQWLIACNEEGLTANPGVQRIRLSDGLVETIVTGTARCDPVRRTPWGTIVFGEENGGGASGGRLYELIDPLNTTGVILNRLTGIFSGGVGASNLTPRAALGRLSFEGIEVYANGLVYFSDENRPSNGTPGGAFFKFIPSTLRNASAPPITDLGQSPLVAGSVFGLRVGQPTGTDFGQASEIGDAKWVAVVAPPDTDMRAQAAALKLTGYYKPEDGDIDRAAEALGNVRFCNSATGSEITSHNYGEVVCLTDGSITQAAANTAIPQVQRLLEGNPQLSMMDNVAFKAGGISFWLFHEDADLLQGNDDLWACLEDGADADLLADACVRVATLNDPAAEWSGGIFDAAGTHFYVSIQHNVTGQGIVVDISGWK